MVYLIGAVLAAATFAFVRLTGLDRDRAVYPVMLIVIASYYELFAAIGGPPAALWSEALGMALFVALAVIGFRRSLWFVVAGMVAHGLFDAAHAYLIEDHGVPAWWPAFCASFDIAAGAFLALILLGTRSARAGAPPARP